MVGYLTLPSDKAQSPQVSGLHANAVRSSGDKTTAPDLRTFDFAGLALLMGAVSCFLAVVQMIQLPQFAKDNFYTLVAVVVALIACSIAFLVTESSMGGNALVPLRLLRPKSLGLFYAAQILYGTGAMAVSIPPGILEAAIEV